MKERILSLRAEGKSYKQIVKELGCSQSTVAYHCGSGQKEKQQKRQTKYKKKISIINKVENFQCKKKLRHKSDDFQRERIMVDGKSKLGNRDITFKWKDVIKKFGWITKCYLTGETIDLKNPTSYQFDHVVSIAKGGPSTLDNLGICIPEANQAKHDMSIDELLVLCKKILEHHNYEVTEKR